ncbi:MAG: hypothetical protein IJ629_01430 [Clostridia bacterium]|nr:hypothetical protein [Clostridia bacterium]
MPKIRNSFLLIITLSFAFILTGCTNADENLENYYYVMAIGIDTSEQAEINLSVQIASNSEQTPGEGSSQSSSSNIYTVPCNSIDSGISILNNFLSKKLNLSHCSAIIVSEELAKNGVKPYINALANNSEIRPTCNIIISNKTSLEALEQISNSNENFSSKFYEFIKSSARYTGYSITPELSEFFYCINYGTNSAIATYAYLSENTIQNTGVAVFREDRFLADLSVLDAVSYSIITDRLESSTISIKNPKNPDQLIDVLIKQIKSPNISCSLVNHYPFIKIDLSIEYDILSSSYDINTDDFAENKRIRTCN